MQKDVERKEKGNITFADVRREVRHISRKTTSESSLFILHSQHVFGCVRTASTPWLTSMIAAHGPGHMFYYVLYLVVIWNIPC
jgi:hypothetical protein